MCLYGERTARMKATGEGCMVILKEGEVGPISSLGPTLT